MAARFVVRSVAVAAAIVCSGVLGRGDDSRAIASSARFSAFPPVMFWAWQRPENLRGLDRRRAGVAFLAATWKLGADGPRVERRRHPLLVDPGTTLLAVVRIESVSKPLPGFSPDQTQRMAASLADLVASSKASGLQIDFDATASEHAFYRALLAETRVALGERPLSMTALVSWCLDDEPLLSARHGGRDFSPAVAPGLKTRPPVDEVVPMLFRLGVPDAARLKVRGAAGALRSRACGSAVGVSMDEPTPALVRGRRLYIFSPRGWTPESARRSLEEVSRWQ